MSDEALEALIENVIAIDPVSTFKPRYLIITWSIPVDGYRSVTIDVGGIVDTYKRFEPISNSVEAFKKVRIVKGGKCISWDDPNCPPHPLNNMEIAAFQLRRLQNEQKPAVQPRQNPIIDVPIQMLDYFISPEISPMPLKLGVIRTENGKGLPLPEYKSAGAAGFDLCAALPEGCTVTLKPGSQVHIPTGFIFEIPEGHEMQLRARSGLAYKYSVGLPNGIGTIDCDYRDEVQVMLVCQAGYIKHTVDPLHTSWILTPELTIKRGDRIAQGVIKPVPRVYIEERTVFTPTARGTGGFGSTGI